ncbi:MAG: peptidylprolyl isomerase [Chitinophagales bacterium]|nr:peptidylprolyl isomerase [Chitinophagales bacterium]
MKGFLTAILLSTLLILQAQEKPVLVDKIVGIVGDEVILLSDIELQYQQMKLETPGLPESFKCQLFDQMLTNKMYLEQAKIDSIKVTDDEVESELNRRIQYFVSMIGSEEKLEAYYEKTILQIKDEFRTDIREQLLAQREQAKIYESVKVTPNEVKEFFNTIPKDSLPYFKSEVEIGQIVIKPKFSATAKQLAIEKLEGIREQIVKGNNDFETLASIYSQDDGSKDLGGDLGMVGRGVMVPEFEAAAFSLQDSMELSPIVESQYGYHLIQLLSRKGEKVHVRHILVIPTITNFDLREAKAKLDSIRNLIVHDSISFEKAVNRFSEDDETKYQGGMLSNPQTGGNSFETDQLDPSLSVPISDMKPGDISQPVMYLVSEREKYYRLLFLKSRTKAHTANLEDDFYKIKAAAQNKKQGEALQKWLKDRIQSTYTFVDTKYLKCDQVEKWNKTGVTIESTYD